MTLLDHQMCKRSKLLENEPNNDQAIRHPPQVQHFLACGDAHIHADMQNTNGEQMHTEELGPQTSHKPNL